MKASLVVSVAAIALALSACATTGSHDATTAYGVASAVTVESDPYDQIVRYRGPSLRESQFAGDYSDYFLRSRMIGDEWVHQIYVSIGWRGEWRHYNRASLLGGEAVEFTRIGSHVEGCSGYSGCFLREIFGATLSDDQLSRGAIYGIAVRFYSQRGAVKDFEFPPHYVEGYLDALGGVSGG